MSVLAAEPRTTSLMALVEEASGQNVFDCNQCGKCMAACPFELQPQRVMRLLQLGLVDDALAHATTWDCASCMTCATNCPRFVSPAVVQRSLRTLHYHVHDRPDFAQANGHVALDAAYRAHAHPLRSWLFGNIARVSRVGSAFAPLSNWALTVPGSGFVREKVLGVHHERPMPPFVHRTFPAWFRRHAPAGDGHRGPVILFDDTFMDYNYPDTGIAVTGLLEKAGFRVELADKVCCGRPMISKGLMDQAAAQATINVARLAEQSRDGARIVGCEPSCLLTLREEYLDFVPAAQRAEARAVADKAVLIDEFLADLHADGELELEFPERTEESRVLFHGHCHQKHSADAQLSVMLLELAGYRAELADAACCGMAGAYGFEKEHYAASREAGERALFPAVRARPDAELAVMGVSCRQQLTHFTGRPARHVVELLYDALP
jgi:Fe-S oxidoreductase